MDFHYSLALKPSANWQIICQVSAEFSVQCDYDHNGY